MEKFFCVRLLPGKGQKGPAIGGDRKGEACLVLSGRGAVCSPSCCPDAGAFIGIGGDSTVILRDDGGNVLHRYRGMHGEGAGSEFALFPLGRFLCALATGSDLMVPEHARCLSLAGTDLLLAFLLPGEGEKKAPFEAVARTRAAENGMFVILAGCSAPPTAFGPDGCDVLPVPGVDGGAEFRLSGDVLSQEGYDQVRRKDLYYSLTAL
ncbi:hypothetical protein SDC9_59251 [bioreactor metagenome]|uniref:CN hydrolase domain-containing protein n=1 Tax=bioreactor metagenome TaxID=1076179 RepID=A0A644X9M7_9ZZZZ|nr:hypothetical protein [Aminivibrio sp.]MDD3515292.1 hypothetical protein [Synergistaceae bacterium]MEA4953741.1 hypothetical protein [Aminivibrio sp.]NCB16869.1 hypothetical protein [Synergistales bacterium]